jgi:hypothetical protein
MHRLLGSLLGLLLAAGLTLVATGGSAEPSSGPASATTYDDRALVRAGPWRPVAARWAHHRTLSRARVSGAALTGPTTGSGGAVTVQVGPGRGTLVVSVAGRTVRRVPTSAVRVRFRTVRFSGAGPVSVSVARPGRRGVFVDALAVVPEPTVRDSTPTGAPTPSATTTPTRAPTPTEEPAPPVPVQVRIAELMPDPVEVTDSEGEWVELLNPGPDPAVLRGCTLTTQAGSASLLRATLAPGASAVLAHTTDDARNGGLGAVGTFAGSLVNERGSVTLDCGSTRVDTVSWATSTPGRARQRDPAGHWCDATQSYHGSDHGTPGRANPGCDPASGAGVSSRRAASRASASARPAAGRRGAGHRAGHRRRSSTASPGRPARPPGPPASAARGCR